MEADVNRYRHDSICLGEPQVPITACETAALMLTLVHTFPCTDGRPCGEHVRHCSIRRKPPVRRVIHRRIGLWPG
jgi:hypothetical protein